MGTSFKKMKATLKKKKVKVMVITQGYPMHKGDGSSVKTQTTMGTVLQKGVKKRYEKTGFIFNNYSNKKMYKSYKKTI